MGNNVIAFGIFSTQSPSPVKGKPSALLRVSALILLCHKPSAGPRRAPTPATKGVFEQGASEKGVGRGNRREHMAFRPYRDRPAAEAVP